MNPGGKRDPTHTFFFSLPFSPSHNPTLPQAKVNVPLPLIPSHPLIRSSFCAHTLGPGCQARTPIPRHTPRRHPQPTPTDKKAYCLGCRWFLAGCFSPADEQLRVGPLRLGSTSHWTLGRGQLPSGQVTALLLVIRARSHCLGFHSMGTMDHGLVE